MSKNIQSPKMTSGLLLQTGDRRKPSTVGWKPSFWTTWTGCWESLNIGTHGFGLKSSTWTQHAEHPG